MTRQLLIGTEDGIHHLDSEVVDLAGHGITALAGNWAITDRRQLWRLDGSGPPVEVAHLDGARPATCLLAIDGTDTGTVLVGTAEGHLVRVEQGVAGPVGGFDMVEGREAWHTPWGGPADVRSMALGDDAVYVNVHVGGILASPDGGVTWSPTDLDIDTDVHQVFAVEHRVLAALGHSGLASSSDGGRSWTVTTDGLHASYCRAVAASDDRVLLDRVLRPAHPSRCPLPGPPRRRHLRTV